MTQVKLKRVYEDMDKSDGYRVLVDRLWPRGMRKEALHYDLWDKDISPSPNLRKWFHENPDEHWESFKTLYQKELSESQAAKSFVEEIKKRDTVTLLYASRETQHNHAIILKDYLDKILKKG